MSTDEKVPVEATLEAPLTPKKKKKEKKETDERGDSKSPKPRKHDPSAAAAGSNDESVEKSPKSLKKERKSKKKDKEVAVQGEIPLIEESLNESNASIDKSPKKSKKKDKSKSPKSRKKETVTAVDAAAVFDEEASKFIKKEKKKKKKKDKAHHIDGSNSDTSELLDTETTVDAYTTATETTGATMRAWQLAAYNADVHAAVDSLKLVDVPMPTITDENHVLIKVSFAAINPVDYKLFSGALHGACPIETFPYTPGFDVAGIVVAVGDNVSKIKVGDKVIADIGLVETCKSPAPPQGPAGAFAEYAVVPQNIVVICNNIENLKMVAGLPLVGLTVYQAMFTGNNKSFTKNPLGSLEEYQRILILGGASATGALAIQMAKAVGATVATTASSASKLKNNSMTKVEFCKSLGADTVIDYTKQDWSEELKDLAFDMILDCVGQPDDPGKAAKVLKAGGLYVSIANFSMEGRCDGVRYEGMLLRSNAEDLQKIMDMVNNKKLKVPIDSIFSFSELQDAMNRQTSGKASGKVILTIGGE
ncbi:hypothetical protein MPSEU_001069800 [Mayamaea pseudoterrestris]|nr:hypothetical protein MPSEU_001069800 [Mayamaea pseudoterrestris]